MGEAEEIPLFFTLIPVLALLSNYDRENCLINAGTEGPTSITALAKRLKRDRSAVTRDVQVLERFGVIQVTEKPLPGHGRQKWITPLAGEIRLTAVL